MSAPDRPAPAAAIRPALPHEAQALRALARRAFAPYVPRMGREPAPMAQDYAADIEAGRAWLAPSPDGPLGLLVAFAEPDAWHLQTVAVAPEAQGTGLGRALIAFAENEGRRRGHALIRLYTNATMTENLRLYPRLGYAETGRRREAGFDRVFFEKPL